MTNSYFKNGFDQAFSDVIAKAAASLPPLTNREDSAFLKHMFFLAMEAFWTNYVAELPADEQESFLKAEDADDDAMRIDWFRDHANFAENEGQREIAERVLADIDQRLPVIMEQEYSSYRQSLHAEA